MLVGATDITAELAEKLQYPQNGFRVLAVVGDKRWKYEKINPKSQFKDFSEATKALRGQNIHGIIQTELLLIRKNDTILSFAQENHIAYRFVPGNGQLFMGSIEVSLFEGIPTVSVHQTSLIGWGRIAKRLFDVFTCLLNASHGTVLLFALVFMKIANPKSRYSLVKLD